MNQQAADPLLAAIDEVVRSGNCSGCGGCALLSERVSMTVASDGYVRPSLSVGVSSRDDEDKFRRLCPGVTVDARVIAAPHEHTLFGPYWSVWEAWATDDELRRAGSSAGVLTTIAAAITEQGGRVVGAAGQPRTTRTVPVQIRSREDAVRAAGSRYAPVGVASLAGNLESDGAFIGKPCEASAVRAHAKTRHSSPPLILTFFCAGTPSQAATDSLVRGRLGVSDDAVDSVRYRGNGWPGSFTVTTTSGTTHDISYAESWGGTLGRALQWRCKVCPDGTGQIADISVGDYWNSDDRGFPVLDVEDDGRSVVICRSERGHQEFSQLVERGLVTARPLELDALLPIQPLQVDRSATMLGRIVASTLAGRRAPRYHGFRIWRNFFGAPLRNAKSAVGTFLRIKGLRR